MLFWKDSGLGVTVITWILALCTAEQIHLPPSLNSIPLWHRDKQQRSRVRLFLVGWCTLSSSLLCAIKSRYFGQENLSPTSKLEQGFLLCSPVMWWELIGLCHWHPGTATNVLLMLHMGKMRDEIPALRKHLPWFGKVGNNGVWFVPMSNKGAEIH